MKCFQCDKKIRKNSKSACKVILKFNEITSEYDCMWEDESEVLFCSKFCLAHRIMLWESLWDL